MATKSKKAIKISQKHLLGIQDLSVSDVKTILNEASKFIELNNGNKRVESNWFMDNYDYLNSIDDEYWTPLNCAMWKGKGIINIKLSKKKKVIELLILNGGKLSELTNH